MDLRPTDYLGILLCGQRSDNLTSQQLQSKIVKLDGPAHVYRGNRLYCILNIRKASIQKVFGKICMHKQRKFQG